MEMRPYGRTGMQVSVLGFGCGAVGGLMVRGEPRDQQRTIARALDAGVNYFDTAVAYGNGESENNLGRILHELKPPNAVVGTKVRLPGATFNRIAETIAASLDESLARLRRDQVDIFHLHNAVTMSGGGEALSVRQVLDEVLPAFMRLREAGKIRFLGLTCVGETPALHEAIDFGRFRQRASGLQHAQSLGRRCAAGELSGAGLRKAVRAHQVAAGTGVIGIRVLAGGALSGSAERHPIASPPPAPIGSALNYDGDIARAQRLMPLVREGFAASLTEAATRFAISQPAVGTILVGMATPQQFEDSLAAVGKGPLPPAALERLEGLRQGFAGEAR